MLKVKKETTFTNQYINFESQCQYDFELIYQNTRGLKSFYSQTKCSGNCFIEKI